MSDNKKQQSAEIINPGLGDIEKVRDILFGKYVANFQQRFSELEERLEADVEGLRDKLIEKIAAMDEMVNASLAKLDEKLGEERRERDQEFQQLHTSLGEAETKLQHAISIMEDETNQGLDSIRKMLDHAREQLSKEAEEQQKRLQDEKVGRQSLALMLDEVAIKLRGDS